MVLLLLATTVFQSPAISRDSYGVPHVFASSWGEAFYQAGFAVAQDRLWQMENARRVSEGRMSEAFGRAFVKSDTETLKTSYTDEELMTQFRSLSPKAQEAYNKYVEGVNSWISEASSKGTLPAGYKDNDLAPTPWTMTDSLAISVNFAQQFGRGGAFELKNLAALMYLKGQPVKDHYLDAFDDFSWENDPSSIPTISPQDDPLARTPFPFVKRSRATLENHLKQVPVLTLFDLLPAIGVASREEQRKVAELRSAVYKVGSYAVVISKEKSATGSPILLGAPQMGFTNPSIVHEMSLSAPGLNVAGMDLPGTPGILIGYTPDLAWTVTSGVADLEDMVYSKLDGESYLYGNDRKPLTKIKRTIRIKGGGEQVVERLSTHYGPVVLKSKGYVFSQHMAFWGGELKALDGLYDLYAAKEPSQVETAARSFKVSFNLFYATKSGNIGYRYCGQVPIRAPGWDPRLPIPGSPDADWKGVIPFEQMPHVVNPSAGYLTNWNNKPVTWWPNSDTPVWGEIFRNELLVHELETGRSRITVPDVEHAAWTIARSNENENYFRAAFVGAFKGVRLNDVETQAAVYLSAANPAYDRRAIDVLKRSYFGPDFVDGSQGARIFQNAFKALREELFLSNTGNFLSPDTFSQAMQPSLMLKALAGQTKYDYLKGRKADDILIAAFKKACDALTKAVGPDPSQWRFVAPSIPISKPPVPYSNRGTYIQLVELGPIVSGRNVLPPGVAETGPHSDDQVPLSRAWTYKPFGWK